MVDLFESEEVGRGLPERKIYSVSQLTEEIRSSLEEEFASVWVSGEISNYKCAPSGHIYLTLKDEAAQIRCVLFKLQGRYLKFKPADGLHVICWGRVSVYAGRGEYQLILSTVEPMGYGGMMLAFEQLKAKLAGEGLFDATRKRSLPKFPKTIGLVTSSKGAAVADMTRIIHRRYPQANIIVSSTSVQGDRAPAEIQSAIERLCKAGNVDVIVVGRGGGSMEDLWAFNDEGVVRAVAACPIPIVSAVGHETDFTLTDFAADLRASTPSAAAELIVPDKRDLQDTVLQFASRLRNCLVHIVRSNRTAVEELTKRLYDPRRKIRDQRIGLDDLSLRLERAVRKLINERTCECESLSARLRPTKLSDDAVKYRSMIHELYRRLTQSAKRAVQQDSSRLENLAASLSALNPLAVLERGYSITFSSKSKKVITDAAKVNVGTELQIQLYRGELLCKLLDKRSDQEVKKLEVQPSLLDEE